MGKKEIDKINVIDGKVIPIPTDLYEGIKVTIDQFSGDKVELKDICKELLEYCNDCHIGANLFPPPMICKCQVQELITDIYAVI